MPEQDLIAQDNKAYKKLSEYKKALQYCTRWKQEYSAASKMHKVKRLTRQQKAKVMRELNLSEDILSALVRDPKANQIGDVHAWLNENLHRLNSGNSIKTL